MLEIWPAWFCATLIQVTSVAWIHEQWLCQSQTLLHSCSPKSASLLVFMPSLPRCSLSGCCWVIQKSLLCSRTLKAFIWPLIWFVLNAVCCTKFLWWDLRSTLLYGYKGKCLKAYVLVSLTQESTLQAMKRNLHTNPHTKPSAYNISCLQVLGQLQHRTTAKVWFNLRPILSKEAHVPHCLGG